MEPIIGHHLYSSDGVDVGEITDLVGDGNASAPNWIRVRTGWFGPRLVPREVVDERDGGSMRRPVQGRADVSRAPSFPVGVDGSGQDLDPLRAYYGLAPVGG